MDELQDVAGWLYAVEGEELARLATGRRVLEVGCFKGRSTIYMARTAERVITVDWFQGDEQAGLGFTWPEAYENVKRYGLLDKVVFVAAELYAGLKALDLSRFDFAFYDAGHAYQVTADALAMFFERLPPGTPVAVHDYKPDEELWEPTVRAVDEAASAHGRTIRRIGGLAILEVP